MLFNQRFKLSACLSGVSLFATMPAPSAPLSIGHREGRPSSRGRRTSWSTTSWSWRRWSHRSHEFLEEFIGIDGGSAGLFDEAVHLVFPPRKGGEESSLV